MGGGVGIKNPMSISRAQIPEKPAPLSIGPEKRAKLEEIPLDLFVCRRVKLGGKKEIMVDFSQKFYRMGNGKMWSYMLNYKKGISGNLDEEGKRKLREAVLAIRELTKENSPDGLGFSAEDLLLKKELLENEYNSGTMPENKIKQLNFYSN